MPFMKAPPERLAPFFQPRPELREGPEFWPMANEDGNLALQCIRIVGGLAHVLDALEEAFQDLSRIVQHNQAIPRIALWTPQKISLVTAEGVRQSIAGAKEIDGSCLTVVLRENTAARPLFGRETAIGLVHCGDHLFPAELIGEVLREYRAHVAMLTARDFERQVRHIGNELLNGKNWHNDGRKPSSACENQRDERGLQPDLARARDITFHHHRTCCQIDRIDWSEIVILAFENDEYRESHQVAPAEEPVGLKPCGEKKCEHTDNPDRREDRVNDENLLGEIGCRGKNHIAAVGLDVVHEFRKRPVILGIPNKIRKEDQKGERATEPDPLADKDAPLLGHQKSQHDGKSENSNRIFFFQANARNDAKP